MTTPGSFDPGRFQAHRAELGCCLGEPLVCVAETGSTNDDALAAAREAAPHGAVFVADAQTRGRGRRGHAWTSPPGENLTCTLMLRPHLPPERVSQLTLVAGLAVRDVAARRVGTSVRIKWPNDVVVGRRKLAGILVESRLSGATVDAVVVGMGVNVRMRELPADIADVATSLALLGDATATREAVLAEVLAALEVRLTDFLSRGLAALLPELRAADALLGERVRVGDVEGVAAGISEDGALLVDDDTARVHAVSSGTVERLGGA